MTENDAEARKRQWRNDLGNQPVQIGVGWTFNVQVPAANVVKRLIVLTKKWRGTPNELPRYGNSLWTCHVKTFDGGIHLFETSLFLWSRGLLLSLDASYAEQAAYMIVTSVCSSKECTHLAWNQTLHPIKRWIQTPNFANLKEQKCGLGLNWFKPLRKKSRPNLLGSV